MRGEVESRDGGTEAWQRDEAAAKSRRPYLLRPDAHKGAATAITHPGPKTTLGVDKAWGEGSGDRVTHDNASSWQGPVLAHVKRERACAHFVAGSEKSTANF